MFRIDDLLIIHSMKGLSTIALCAFVLFFVLLVSPAAAQDNETCFMCHEDADMGAQYVNPDRFARSVHGDFECILCHEDLDGVEDFPHDDNLMKVDCGSCHDDVAELQRASVHGQAAARGDPSAPSCSDCHGVHDVLAAGAPGSPLAIGNIPFLCGRCHHEGTEVSIQHDIPQDHILENYSESIHGEGLFRKGLTVTAVCTSCHGAHEILPHTNPASSINRDNVSATCQKCHTRIEEVHRKVIRGHLWEEEPHKVPVCVDCHSPHKIRNVFYPQGMANKDCLTCHEDPDLTMTRDGRTVSLYVDEHDYLVSSHGSVSCAQCHTDVSPSLVRSCETIQTKVDCSICHAEVVSEYEASIHGVLAAKGDPDAPSCLDCHEKHSTLRQTQPHSPTFSRNIPDLCARCHRAGEKAAVRIEADVPDIVQAYEMSIHGKGLFESGLVVTANCADCHGAHGILPPSDPASSVNRHNVADTCGRCHHGIEEEFKTSVHWPEGHNDDKKRPTCEDCHSSHTISRVDRADFRLNILSQCGHCHKEETETFFDTYHGKVSRLGSARAAKCHDCHGRHGILPPDNPNSTLSRANVVATCGQCHEGSNRKFAGYLTHATHHDRRKYPFLFWTFWGMTSLLVGTLAFASVHTGAWMWRSSRTLGFRKPALPRTGKVYRRFSAFQRLLHLGMLLSFFTLAVTGMALKFSYMSWAKTVSNILGGFDSMGFLHRVAALTLITVFAIHVNDLRQQKNASGMSWKEYITRPNSLLFNLNDLRELWGSLKWFVGAGPRPAYGRYSYWEKFDYFAVFWGVAVIGSTGLVLWFPEIFTRLLPGSSVNVATIIHSDEALLAVAFIFTVHFFNTHFRPGKFPMDPVIFTGQVSLEELKEDKPGEYEELMASGRVDDNLVSPVSSRRERVFKTFGFVALTIGLTLIALIIYTMIFGYR